ncbi:MAG: hypothetical protein R6U64_03335 [Bacteroidales bacterium]
MIRTLSFLVVMIFVTAGLAQDPAPDPEQAPPAGLDSLKVAVKQDPKIEWLLKAHQQVLSRQRGIPGFRIQVHVESGNQSRVRIQNKKFEFEELFPQIHSYIVYDAPYFKLRVGDFRTRLEARKVWEQIASEYGDAFIVVDEINPPEIELQQQQQDQ